MILLDTSVLVAAIHLQHMHHDPSLRLLESATPEIACCSTHAIAELFAVITGMRSRPRTSALDATSLIQSMNKKLIFIELGADDYLAAMQQVSSLGLSGGIIYDALHVQCARKVNATTLYTWNIKHFRMIAPELASIIQQP